MVKRLKLWRSTNGAQGFVASDQNLAPGSSPWGPIIHLDHREILFHPADSNRVYNTSDGGFAVSTNGGLSWTPRNDDLQITGFQSLAASPLTGAVIAASQDNGGQLWNGNRRWDHLDCCGDGGFSVMDRNDVLTMIIGNNWGFPERSTNGGVSWSSFSSGLPSSEPRLFYAPFIQDPSAPHPLYYDTNRLYRRAAGDASWTAVSPVLATGTEPEIATASSTSQHLVDGGRNAVTAIAVAPSDPDRLYVGLTKPTAGPTPPPMVAAPSCSASPSSRISKAGWTIRSGTSRSTVRISCPTRIARCRFCNRTATFAPRPRST